MKALNAECLELQADLLAANPPVGNVVALHEAVP